MRIINRTRLVKAILRSLVTLIYPRNLNRRYWRNYFQSARTRRTAWSHCAFTGWTVSPNDVDLHNQVNAMTSLGADGETFYVGGTILDPHLLTSTAQALKKIGKETEMADRLASYLNPRCQCKLGPHWGCPVHYTWEG